MTSSPGSANKHLSSQLIPLAPWRLGPRSSEMALVASGPFPGPWLLSGFHEQEFPPYSNVYPPGKKVAGPGPNSTSPGLSSTGLQGLQAFWARNTQARLETLRMAAGRGEDIPQSLGSGREGWQGEGGGMGPGRTEEFVHSCVCTCIRLCVCVLQQKWQEWGLYSCY